MKKIVLATVFLLGMLSYSYAQMKLFEGSFEEAMKKAKEEKKDLFVDFYADWCEPCKMMADQVFTLPEVGEYFNPRFICVKVNVEAKENKEITKKYNVMALPTMVFIGRDGKEIRRITGVKDPDSFIREAKIVTGEELSFEQLYEKYKKKKKDFQIQQQLLMEAPTFVAMQEGYNQQKWSARIESLFPEYWKNKGLEQMINEVDFYILTLYHSQMEKSDPIFDFITTHFNEFEKVVGKEKVAGYLIGMNNNYIIQLCQKGDLAYKDRLGRVEGDLNEVYANFSFGSLSVLEAITLLADATYNLYRHNEKLFFENMNKYFAGKGDQVELNDYTQALESLARVYRGEMSESAYRNSIPWASKALEMDMDAELRTRLLVILGQCLQKTGEREKAKQAYNQAFLTSAQVENKMRMVELQQMIQQGLESL